jgi:tRNA (guanosine-2'-O-)-methyltransferase
MRHDSTDVIEITGPPELTRPASDVIRVLSGMITPTRLGRIEAAARGRTLGVVPVLDGLSDPHNASAILRSSEAFGVQAVHLVPGPHGFRATRSVEKGSSRWLDIQLHADSATCADAVVAAGYQLFIAVMDGDETPELLADRVASGERVAVAFGNEREGISDAMRARATGSYRVPMRGFVESLNVSVAAATTLYTITSRAPRLASEAEVERLIARYLMHSVHDAEAVLDLHLDGR